MDDDDDDLGPEFEIDFMVAMFMLDDHSMTFEAAREKALQWFKEARE